MWTSTVCKMPEDVQYGETSRGLKRLQVVVISNKKKLRNSFVGIMIWDSIT